MAKALRLFYYQGALQGLAMQESEDDVQQTPSRYTAASEAPRISATGVDMRHNLAAAQAAARGLKGEHAEEVKVVPLESWMSMAPPGTVTRTEVG